MIISKDEKPSRTILSNNVFTQYTGIDKQLTIGELLPKIDGMDTINAVIVMNGARCVRVERVDVKNSR